jgi:hypothetical protein
MKNSVLVLLLLTIFSCSIIRTVDVADYNKKTQKILGQAEMGIRRVEMDLIDHEQILGKWADEKSKQSMFRMRSLQQNLLQNYVRLKEDFENSQFRHKNKITSKEKEYPAFNSYQEDFETRFENLDKQFDKYRTESNQLNAYLESKSIFKVNSQKIQSDFKNSINDAKRSQLKVKNELMEYSQNLNKSSLDAENKKTQKIIIQDLVKMVEKMENETFKLQRLFNAAMKEIHGGVKFVTPGMKAHGYLDKIQTHVKAIQIQIDQFNLKSKTLND